MVDGWCVCFIWQSKNCPDFLKQTASPPKSVYQIQKLLKPLEFPIKGQDLTIHSLAFFDPNIRPTEPAIFDSYERSN